MPNFCTRCGSQITEDINFCQKCGNNLTGTGNPSSIMEYAGFWRRFVANIIDAIIINIFGFIIGFIFGFMYGFSTGTTEGVEVLSFILGILIGWVYYAGLESSSSQATFGKSAIGIIVTDLSGNRISFGKATARHFAKIISVLILFIGFLMIGFTEKKQGLHDMIAGCYIIVKK